MLPIFIQNSFRCRKHEKGVLITRMCHIVLILPFCVRLYAERVLNCFKVHPFAYINYTNWNKIEKIRSHLKNVSFASHVQARL